MAELTFLLGLFLAVLGGWYLLSAEERMKRILGSFLTVSLTALALFLVYPPEQKIRLGIDLKGGTSFLLQLQPDNGNGGAKVITPKMLEQACEVIRRRVDGFGNGEPLIAPQGTDRILVQIPGLSQEQITIAREQLYKPAKLEFKLVHPENEAMLAGAKTLDPEYRIEKVKSNGERGEEGRLVVRRNADVPGTMLQSASKSFGPEGWQINLVFTKEGGELFGKLTQENVGRRFAIMLDGIVQSAPTIKTAITQGSAVITGKFTEAEAQNLVSVLENPLETELKILHEGTASATLGADAIHSGVYSGVIGLVVTAFCVLLYYRFSGVVAILALVVNLLMLFGAMVIFGTVLTLPGIAGVILTLGMAIDANVLIYERLREELVEKRSLKSSVNAAFEKAFSAIFDSNVTTLITALILFWKATGPVKGFAIALIIGIVATLFTSLVVTRNLFSWALHKGLLKEVRMASLMDATEFNFLGWRRAAITGSILVMGASIAIFSIRGEKNFGVDFRGGDRVVLMVGAGKAKPDVAAVRTVVEDLKLGEVTVQMEKSAEKDFVTVRSPKQTGAQVVTTLVEKFPEAGLTKESEEQVGSLVGNELRNNSLMALTLGMLGILVYVTARFEFSFALGALVALLHDVVITMGVFALLGKELSLVTVGAVLTIAGYSVNDTIVVFDRIREGLQMGRKGSVLEIMNLSVNETLSRTILTGGVTLLTTISLFFFGGPVLADFALTILVGVLVGTYSSVFVASPVVLWWSNRNGNLRGEVLGAVVSVGSEETAAELSNKSSAS